MNLSPIGSSNSEPSIALNNTTIEAEKQLAAAEKQALEAGKHLPAHKQNEYNLMVRRGANQIRLQISKMKSQGKIEYDISLTVKVLVKDFNASMNGFIEKNRAYDSAKTQVNRNYQLMTSRLENLSSTFTPIQRQFFYDEFSDDEVDYNEDLSFNDEEHVSFESSLPTFTEKACNFNSVTKKVCYATGLLSKAPNALILTASLNAGTDNIAGNFMLNKPDLSSFKKIETRFDTKYLQISDTKSLCRAIDNEKANGVAIKLLIIRAHGTRYYMTLDALDGLKYLSVTTNLPKKSCLHNLAPKATIILESCSTGEGREEFVNLANHVAANSREDTIVFAPTKPISHFVISKEKPLGIKFCEPPFLRNELRNPRAEAKINTYKIDAKNRALAIKNQGVG